MKASVNPELCNGSGLCAQTCPQVFQVQDGKAKVMGDVPPDTEQDCREAAQGCPTEAISIEE
jgi:ferredoxin